MIYDLSNELQAKSFKMRCNALYKKGGMVELTQKKPLRTGNQNRYLHAALGYFALQTGNTLQEVKDWYFKERCNPELFIRTRSDAFGISHRTLRSTADLTTAEMTVAIERFRDWAAAEADIYIPSPEEHRLVMQMEKEVMCGARYL